MQSSAIFETTTVMAYASTESLSGSSAADEILSIMESILNDVTRLDTIATSSYTIPEPSSPVHSDPHPGSGIITGSQSSTPTIEPSSSVSSDPHAGSDTITGSQSFAHPTADPSSYATPYSQTTPYAITELPTTAIHEPQTSSYSSIVEVPTIDSVISESQTSSYPIITSYPGAYSTVQSQPGRYAITGVQTDSSFTADPQTSFTAANSYSAEEPLDFMSNTVSASNDEVMVILLPTNTQSNPATLTNDPAGYEHSANFTQVSPIPSQGAILPTQGRFTTVAVTEAYGIMSFYTAALTDTDPSYSSSTVSLGVVPSSSASTAPLPTLQSSLSHSSILGIVLGSVIGGIVLITLICLGIRLYVRRRSKADKTMNARGPVPSTDELEYVSIFSRPSIDAEKSLTPSNSTQRQEEISQRMREIQQTVARLEVHRQASSRDDFSSRYTLSTSAPSNGYGGDALDAELAFQIEELQREVEILRDEQSLMMYEQSLMMYETPQAVTPPPEYESAENYNEV